MRTRHITLSLIAAGSLALTACSAGSLGSSDDKGGDGKVSLSFLVDNGAETVKIGNQLAKDFMAKNRTTEIRVEPGPAGTAGDNLFKTRLSTGDMSDIF